MNKVRIAYLILAHKNPGLIRRMIDSLSCDACAFFIHIDRKSDIDDFSSIRGENIYFSADRVRVYWAEYSMVEAILVLLRRAMGMPHEYDYYVLLSGSDYPLRSKEYIHKFFAEHKGVEFISLVEIPNTQAGIPLCRVNTLRIPSNRPAYRLLVRLLAKMGFAQRDYRQYLGALRPYGGSTWWALTRGACEYILEFIENNPAVCRYFETTFAADEIFFHTILGNSMFSRQIRRNLMYDDWLSVGPHPAHPALIREDHIRMFEAKEKVIFQDVFGSGEMLFARKLSDDNPEIIRRLDDIGKRKG